MSRAVHLDGENAISRANRHSALPRSRLDHPVAKPPNPRHRALCSLPHDGVFWQHSYPLYLWHWPIYLYALSWYGGSVALGAKEKVVLFASAVLISHLSFRAVEQPIRQQKRLERRRTLFAAAICASLLLLGTGAAGVLRQGFPSRFGPLIADIDHYSNYNYQNLYREGTCFLQPQQPASEYSKEQCFVPVPDKQNVLLWGDSIAAHYYKALALMLEDAHVLQANRSSCPPFLGDFNIPLCQDFNKKLLFSISFKHPDAVILCALWQAYYGALGYRNFFSVLHQIVEKLDALNVKVILFGPSIITESLLNIIATRRRAMNTGASEFIFPGLFELDRRMGMEFSKSEGGRYVSILNAVCFDGVCPMFATKSVTMQWDSGHLTAEGSQFVISHILPLLSGKIGSLQK